MRATPIRWCEDRHPRRHWLQTRHGRFRHLRLRNKGGLDPQWLALLDAENVQTVILSRYEDCGLLRLLHRSPQWAVDFADRRSVILVRRVAANVVELG